MPSIFANEVVDLAILAHERSIAKYESEPNDLVRDAFFALTHDAICVHRAAISLVDGGWSSPAASLVRTLMDISVSAIAVARSATPRMAAFRYLYSGLRRHSRDPGVPREARRRMFDSIRQRLNQLPSELRGEAIEVAKDRDRAYWFAPEWQSPTAVLDAFGRDDLKWTYMQLSAAAHGTFLGMRLFRDNPDGMDVNPRPLGPRGMSVDLTSARWLAEIVRIRTVVERLELSSEIDAFVRRISEAVARLPKAPLA